MRFVNARVIPLPDEEGNRQAYATIELAEYEIEELRADKAMKISGGVTLPVAEALIADIRVLDRARHMISLERKYKP